MFLKHISSYFNIWKFQTVNMLIISGNMNFLKHISSYFNIWKFQTVMLIISGNMNFEKGLCFIMGYSLPWKHVTLFMEAVFYWFT